jgi:cytoskeleton-associated protein 5
VDLSQLVNGELITQLSDAKWQVRKEALDAIGKSIEKARKMVRISNGDILNELKNRFGDTNKNLVIQSLDLCGLIAEASGGSFEKFLKVILSSVIGTLSDNKLQVRASSLKCMDSFKSVCRASSFIGIANNSLSVESPNLKRELLMWLTKVIQNSPEEISSDDITPLLVNCLNLLQDRTMEVRKAAQSVIAISLLIIDSQSLKSLCQEHRPSSINSIQNIIESSNLPRKALASNASAQLSNSSNFFLLQSDPNLKNVRAEKDKGVMKWTIESMGKEQIEHLKDQMSATLRPGLLQLLTSEDFKDHLSGLGQIESAVAAAGDVEKEIIVSNLDLLLKYITLRFLDSNVSILMKCFDLVERLLAVVDNSNFRLSEYEANAFIPFFINKAGECKDTLRAKAKTLFRQLCRIYPASKLFGHLMEGLKSKNSRCRIVCLDEMNSLLSRNGLVVLNPAKHIPVIASSVSDRDAAVRNASLDVLVKLASLMGDQLSKYLSDLSQKELDMFEERLKRSRENRQEPSQEENDMEETRTMQVEDSRTGGPFSLDYAQFESKERFVLHQHATPVSSTKLQEPTPPFPFSRHVVNFSGKDEHPLDRLIAKIRTSADIVCIEAIQNLDEYMNPIISGELSSRINALIPCLSIRLKSCTISQSDDKLMSRLCRYVTNALVILASEVALPKALTCDSLIILLAETLSALVSKKIESFEDAEQLNRALNILLVKTLETTNRNLCYRALLILMEQAFRVPPAQDEKYPEFIMKCLWKLTKQLPGHVENGEMAVDDLLLDIHNFFVALPPVEWKTRASDRAAFEDLPLRTVKTILHELTVVKGAGVLFDAKKQIPDFETSFVTSYLKSMLQSMNVPIPELSDPAPPQQMDDEEEGPTRMPAEEIEATLKDICGRICSKPNTRSGLLELYELRKAHGYAAEQINLYLEQLGSFFYKYITRNLEQLEAEERLRADFNGLSTDRPGGSVEMFKSRLSHLQSIIPAAGGGMVTSEEAASPVRSRLDSPFAKVIGCVLSSVSLLFC